MKKPSRISNCQKQILGILDILKSCIKSTVKYITNWTMATISSLNMANNANNTANNTANIANTMQSTTVQGVEPLFLKNADMPTANTAHIAIVRAISRSISPQSIDGVQRIGHLWRIYFKNKAARLQLMAKKNILLSGKLIPLYEQNPFTPNQNSPDVKRDKLTIRGLPVSLSSEEVSKMLVSKNIVLTSDVKFSLVRDEFGSLTSIKTGDRFVFCEPFAIPLPRHQKVGIHSCEVIHHGKDGLLCKACNTAGHRVGDPTCVARAEEGSILGFSGYMHPLSNHFPTSIVAFGEEKPFDSVEQAFSWKMATDLSLPDLAAQIRNAPHAGVVKRLCNEIGDDEKLKWEDDNLDIMKSLLQLKASSCPQFLDCLKSNKNKILAESTFNKKWGTGLSKWVTEATKPDFWSGTNLLGVMLMELTEELFAEGFSAENESEDEMSTSEEYESDIADDEDNDKDIEQTQDITTENTQNEDVEGTQENTTDNTQNGVNTENAAVSTPEFSRRKGKRGRNRKKGQKGMNPNNQDTAKTEESSTLNKADTSALQGSTASKSRNLDIRAFFDPKTGKRKAPETTPEKQEHSKKQVT